ncbi:MAG: DUF1275 domain-containing protein [Acidobacteriaceae bacterium]|nr:DUF1275 domain-containing protein [Acidobacteriaceae bacterium]
MALCLAAVAGYVDGYALRSMGTFVSFMSGNTTIAGVQTGAGQFRAALPAAVAILSFFAGSFAGNWIAHGKSRFSHNLLFGTAAALLAITIVLRPLGLLNTEVWISLLSIAMGTLNPTLSRVGAENVNLTFVTGALNKAGNHLALAARKVALADARGVWDSQLRRAGIETSIWASFLCGAILSGIMRRLAGLELLPALIVLVFFALFSSTGAERLTNAQPQRG